MGGELWTLLRNKVCFDEKWTKFYTACCVEALGKDTKLTGQRPSVSIDTGDDFSVRFFSEPRRRMDLK